MNKSIRWLQYSVVLILLVISLISIFNYKVDSLGIFGNSNYLSKAAKALTSGKMIAGLQNIDDRLFQDLIIKNLQVRNDIVAIGSSTAMMLRKDFVSKYETNFFNHSVNGASLEDYIAIIGAYESIHGYLPSTVILGVDPWVFNKYNGQGRWKGLKTYYDYEVNRIYSEDVNLSNIITINTSKWKQLINFEYTVSNIKFFIRTLLKNESNKKFYIVSTTDSANFIRGADGSIYYPNKIRNINDAQIKESAIAFTIGSPYSLEKYDTLSSVKLFEDFIRYLKLNKVNVTLLLPPYNPITYDLLLEANKYNHILIAEDYLINFAKLNDVDLKGSYNPHKYDLTYQDFYDGVHGRDLVLKKIFDPVL
jgi:hypothetical protein